MQFVERVRLIAVATSLALTSGVAWGANADDAAAAEALFNRGRQLVNEGKFAEACPKLAESQRLDPGVGTALNLADCYERQGRTATAWATWLEAATLAKQGGQEDREELARSRAKALEARLTRLEIALAPGAKVEGLRVTRSGTELREVSFGIPLPVDPGEQVIEASAPGYKPFRTTVRADQPGGQVTVTIPRLAQSEVVVAPAPAPAPAAPAPLPIAPQATPAPAPATTGQPVYVSAPATTNGTPAPAKPVKVKSTRRTLGKVFTFVGAGGLVVGGVSALVANALNEASKDDCNPNDPNRCNGDGYATREAALSAGSTATIFAVAGGILTTTGLVLWISAPSATQVGAVTSGDDARLVFRRSF